MVKIGINGFGRLGRQLLRVTVNRCKEKSIADLPRVTLVNDPNITVECMASLLKNDTYYGKFMADVSVAADSITIDGLKIDVSREANLGKIPWANCGVDYVIDTTGLNTTCAQASNHLSAGVKRVIVTGCTNTPMFVLGVNHACFTKEMKTLSVTTPSMNCLVTMLRILHENFEVEHAMATAFHPLNASDKILDDMSSRGCRESRSAIMNFAPTTSTTTRKLLDRIMPELEAKTESAAIKIPVPCVGGMDLTVKFRKEAPLEIIKARLKEASETYMKDIVGYTDEELVSSDIIGNANSCVIDSKAVVPFSRCMAKIFAWYDGEYAFATRLFEMAKYVSSREDCVK